MRLARWLAALTVPALALRVLYLLEIRKLLFFDHPVLDAIEYVRWGREIAEGRLLWPELRIHGPLYPFFVGAVFAIARDSFFLLGILQAIVGVASAWVAAAIARELIDGVLAPIAAFSAIAFGWIFVYYDGQWMPTTFVVFFDLLGAWSTIRAWEGRTRWAVGAGLAFAASALAWGPGVAFLPVAALAIAFGHPPSLAPYKRAAACLLAGGALLAPVLLWNHHLAGQWTLTQANATLNLYIGNNPEANGLPYVRPGCEWEELTQRGAMLPERYLADAEAFWRRHPDQGARLLGKKACLLVAAPEVCPSQDIGHFREASRALSLPWLPSGVLIPLGVVGLAVALGRPQGRRLVAIAAPALLLPLVFTVCSRYRLPFEALSAPAAGFLVAWFLRGEARFAGRATALAVAGLLIVASYSDPAGAGAARLFRTHDFAARELMREGLFDEALREVNLERDVNPNDTEVVYDEAVLRLLRGERESAQVLLWGLPWGPRHRFSLYGWRQMSEGARLLLEAGRPGDALWVCFYGGVGQFHHPVVKIRIGEALRRLGRLHEAIQVLRDASSYKPPIPDAWVSLGAALGQAKRYAEAAQVLEKAVELAPEDPQAWYNLAVACHLLGRKGDAVRAATRARDLGHKDGEALLGTVSK